jgi:hypothetical protein
MLIQPWSGMGELIWTASTFEVLEQVLKLLIANVDFPIVPAFLELVRVALANGVATRVRVLLPDGDKLGPEPEANDCDVEFTIAHGMENCGLVEGAGTRDEVHRGFSVPQYLLRVPRASPEYYFSVWR